MPATIKSFFSILSVEILTKIVGGIAATLAAALTGLLGTLYVKYKNDWQVIRQLRNGDRGCYKFYLLCGLLKIFLGHFYCCCYGCCTRKTRKVSTDSNKSTIGDGIDKGAINDWIDFINNKAKAITTIVFEDMKKNYQNYQYRHQHYCYKNGKKCNPSECEHDTSRKCKGLVRNPMLYLLELDFSVNIKDSLNKYERSDKTIKELCEMYNKHPLEFIFAVALSKDYKGQKAFQEIGDSLDEKIKNVCIVATNFPSKIERTFGDGEKLLLQSLFQLRKKIQLIYNVR